MNEGAAIMKKSIVFLLLVILALAACSRKEGGGTENNTEAKKPVRLSMWMWDDIQVPAMQAMLNGFTAKYPWITVELTSIPGALAEYTIKMQSVLGTRDAPNVFWLFYTLAREYVPTGYIADLTQLINDDKDFDITALNAGVAATYTFDGKIYAIPKDLDPSVCFYNKALFDEAGVPYPNDNWTMREFAETARKLTRGNIAGWSNATNDRMWYAFIWGNGGEIYNPDGTQAVINSPEAVEAVQNYLDIMNNGWALNGAQLAEMSTSSAFVSELCAMTVDGSWSISIFADALGDKLGITELPSGKTGKGTTINGLGYATTTFNSYPEETWLLLSYLGSAEAQAMQVEVAIPAADAVAEKWADVYPNLNVQPFVKALEYARHIPLAAKNPSRTRNVATEYFANMRAGMYANAKEAMDAAKKAMDASINE
jgi:multiple sugar transport system substrate-binding protein